MKEPIKDCPFCGSACAVESQTFGDSMREYFRVYCDEGHMLDCWEESPEKAIATWNQRP